MHRLCNIVRDHALQFADKTLKDRHLFAGEKSGLRHVMDMMRDRLEVFVDTGKRLISFQFAGKMVPSHIRLSYRWILVRGALLFPQHRVSLPICTATQVSAQEGCRESARGVYVQTGEFLCRSRFMCKAVAVQSGVPSGARTAVLFETRATLRAEPAATVSGPQRRRCPQHAKSDSRQTRLAVWTQAIHDGSEVLPLWKTSSCMIGVKNFRPGKFLLNLRWHTRFRLSRSLSCGQRPVRQINALFVGVQFQRVPRWMWRAPPFGMKPNLIGTHGSGPASSEKPAGLHEI